MLAVIGTAGRDKAQQWTVQLWNAMCADLLKHIKPTDFLISGGAAWADHLAVWAMLNGHCAGLELQLPAPIDEDTCSFEGGYGTAGGTAQFYHEKFSEIIGVNTIEQIIQVAQMDEVRGGVQPVSQGFHAMFKRNAIVASKATGVIAYTWGVNGVAEGGTKNTWDQIKSNNKIHVSLYDLVGKPKPEVVEGPRVMNIFSKKKPITQTKEATKIFVFGSNLAGRHGKGAALDAVQKHGAIYGQGDGLQGNSYAIPTKGMQLEVLSLDVIEEKVHTFIKFAQQRQDLTFMLTRVGCGLAGYTDDQIAPLFRGVPENVEVPAEWKPYLNQEQQEQTQQFKWNRKGGYECSSKGDQRFSALYAELPDGRSVEMHYQCDVKGYQPGGTNWKLGKGKPPLNTNIDLYDAYLALWIEWAENNPDLIEELRQKAIAYDYTLSDMFATTDVNQARALADILNCPF